jgi:3-methyladenine DNA glycosylase Tag
MARARKQSSGGLPDSDYLEALSRRIMAAGLSWSVVEDRWEAIRIALHAFEPEWVAALDQAAADAVLRAPRMLRNPGKLGAVIANARVIADLSAGHGSLAAWLESRRELPWADRAAEWKHRFSRVGERTAWRFLKEVGEPVPEPPPWEGDAAGS